MSDLANEIAPRLGISAAKLQSYWRAANYMGFQHPHVDQAIATFSRRLKQARQGDDRSQRVFLHHAIDATDDLEQAVEQCFRLIDGDAPTPDRTAAAADFFGDEGRVMLQVAAAWNQMQN